MVENIIEQEGDGWFQLQLEPLAQSPKACKRHSGTEDMKKNWKNVDYSTVKISKNTQKGSRDLLGLVRFAFMAYQTL